MNYLFRTLPCLASVMLLGASAQAHPGHGTTEPAALHYLSEPVHAVWLTVPVALAGLTTLAIAFRRRGSAERG